LIYIEYNHYLLFFKFVILYSKMFQKELDQIGRSDLFNLCIIWKSVFFFFFFLHPHKYSWVWTVIIGLNLISVHILYLVYLIFCQCKNINNQLQLNVSSYARTIVKKKVFLYLVKIFYRKNRIIEFDTYLNYLILLMIILLLFFILIIRIIKKFKIFTVIERNMDSLSLISVGIDELELSSIEFF